jgi:hypothetical protein
MSVLGGCSFSTVTIRPFPAEGCDVVDLTGRTVHLRLALVHCLFCCGAAQNFKASAVSVSLPEALSTPGLCTHSLELG